MAANSSSSPEDDHCGMVSDRVTHPIEGFNIRKNGNGLRLSPRNARGEGEELVAFVTGWSSAKAAEPPAQGRGRKLTASPLPAGAHVRVDDAWLGPFSVVQVDDVLRGEVRHFLERLRVDTGDVGTRDDVGQ
jgi:hypothetical protein